MDSDKNSKTLVKHVLMRTLKKIRTRKLKNAPRTIGTSQQKSHREGSTLGLRNRNKEKSKSNKGHSIPHRRHLRMLKRAGEDQNGQQMNDDALRTFMREEEAVVNSRRLTTESITSPGSAEALTPNHLLTLKTRVLLPPPGAFKSADFYSKKWWRLVQHLTNDFWCRWRREFLLSLRERQ